MYTMVREGEINKNHDTTTGSCFGGAIQHAKYALGFLFPFLHSSIFDIGGFINGITSEGMLMPIFLLNKNDKHSLLFEPTNLFVFILL